MVTLIGCCRTRRKYRRTGVPGAKFDYHTGLCGRLRRAWAELARLTWRFGPGSAMQTCSISAGHAGPDAGGVSRWQNRMPWQWRTATFCSTLRSARYSVSGEGKCVLHLWSEDRNTVRRVLDAEQRGRRLRLTVLSFRKIATEYAGNLRRPGAPHAFSATRSADAVPATAGARAAARVSGQSGLSKSAAVADLEHSLSPVYTRALLRTGQSAFAVLGVNQEESQPSIDAALTFGIVWMDYQRERLAGRALVEGLKLFATRGSQRDPATAHGASGWKRREVADLRTR